MTETIGQRSRLSRSRSRTGRPRTEEDDAAFLGVWRNHHRTKGWWIVIGQGGTQSGAGQRKHDVRERELMRYTYDAGMKRGEEKRGEHGCK